VNALPVTPPFLFWPTPMIGDGQNTGALSGTGAGNFTQVCSDLTQS
jgi:hypothetical protein